MGLLDFLPTIAKIIDKIIPDPQAKAAAQLELVRIQQTGELAALAAETDLAKGQLDINKQEATSTNLFVSGWRPFIGWVCGLGVASQFVFGPLFTWASTLAGHATAFPTLDLSTLLTLLFSMLGLGAMRTTEKINGVASK